MFRWQIAQPKAVEWWPQTRLHGCYNAWLQAAPESAFFSNPKALLGFRFAHFNHSPPSREQCSCYHATSNKHTDHQERACVAGGRWHTAAVR